MTPEEKAMHGGRELNDDGFTYVHGKHKGGYKKRTRNKNTVHRCLRSDKRSVRSREMKRMLEESY